MINLAGRPPLCRIVLPPRTGKTVVAAHIIERTGLTAIFIVPTKNLVRQVARELETQLVDIPVGMYYGDVKQVVEHGVNVATYMISPSSGSNVVPGMFRSTSTATSFANAGTGFVDSFSLGELVLDAEHIA